MTPSTRNERRRGRRREGNKGDIVRQTHKGRLLTAKVGKCESG